MIDVRKNCPDVIIFSSDYSLYRMYSERMYKIVQRYSSKVEEYSIDECFGDITGMDVILKKSYEEIAKQIKYDLDNELGTTFSIGLSVNKVLAKTASKFQKPSGLTFIPFQEINNYLSKTPIGKIWGMGPSTSIELSRYKIYTALEFVSKPKEWAKEFLSKPLEETYYELQGKYLFEVDSESRDTYKSVMRTRTFRPSSKDKKILLSELSQNVEEACHRLRSYGLVAQGFSFFLKTQDFRYKTFGINLLKPTSLPQEILKEIQKHFNEVFEPNTLYRTTGVRFYNLIDNQSQMHDLFGESQKSEKISKLYQTVDSISRKHGENSIFLSSSLGSNRKIFISKKILNIPSLGEVR